MISHKYKCIFIHKGRTGGTSIEFALGETVDGPEKHLPQRMMRSKYKNYWKDYYKFTCVRNPYDWMVSAYIHNRDINYKWFDETYGKNIKEMNFIDFIYTCKNDVPVYDNINELDFIIRFETLQLDFNYVCSKIDKPQQVLDKIESSNHRPHMEYYDNEETIYAVNRICKYDFENFNYEMLQ